jgi:hypothetical protein
MHMAHELSGARSKISWTAGMALGRMCPGLGGGRHDRISEMSIV